MFDPIIYLLFAVLILTVLFGTVPLVIAVRMGDRHRIERLLDLYIEISAAGASAIIGALNKIFRRKDHTSEVPPNKRISPPDEY